MRFNIIPYIESAQVENLNPKLKPNPGRSAALPQIKVAQSKFTTKGNIVRNVASPNLSTLIQVTESHQAAYIHCHQPFLPLLHSSSAPASTGDTTLESTGVFTKPLFNFRSHHICRPPDIWPGTPAVELFIQRRSSDRLVTESVKEITKTLEWSR